MYNNEISSRLVDKSLPNVSQSNFGRKLKKIIVTNPQQFLRKYLYENNNKAPEHDQRQFSVFTFTLYRFFTSPTLFSSYHSLLQASTSTLIGSFLYTLNS